MIMLDETWQRADMYPLMAARWSVAVIDKFSMVAGTQLVYELCTLSQHYVYTPCHAHEQIII